MTEQIPQQHPLANDVPPMIEGHWYNIARATWLLITGVGVSMYAVGVRLLAQRLATLCDGADCLRQQLTPESLPTLAEIGLTLPEYAVIQVMPSVIFAVVCLAVGALIFWQRSHEVMAFSSSLWLVTFGLTLIEDEVRMTGWAYPWLQPVAFVLIWLGGIILLLPFFLIFPNGRFTPRWTKWVWLVTVIFFVSLAIVGELSPAFTPIYLGIAGYLWLSMVLGGIVVQVYRYRVHSTSAERQQTKWVVFSFLLTATVLVALSLMNPRWLDFGAQEATTAANNIFGTAAPTLAFTAIPVGIGISILRYRLYDIDLIVRKTLQYTIVTALLAGVYFGSVVLLQSAFGAALGESPLLIVASTLLIAALFNPLRRRVQDGVDRRFYRKKYDAQQVLAQFAQTCRDETELERLSAELQRVIDDTLRPEQISLWLKP